jgi:hypothetical protein
MDIANNFYAELQTKQRELHAKIRNADDEETDKSMKALHKKLETIDKLITLVLKYIYETKS